MNTKKNQPVMILDKTVRANDCKVEFFVSMSDELTKYFTEKRYSLEYSESIKDVPDAVLNVVWLTNVLPLVWLTDAEVIIDELDQQFYHCIENIKKGFLKKYPHLTLKGKVSVKKLVDCSYETTEDHRSIALNSGGVDAMGTVLRYIDENPLLLTIRGLDISEEEIKGWDILYQQILETSEALNLKNVTVLSGLKSNVNYDALGDSLLHEWNHNDWCWWSDIQHGIAVISHTFPLAYKYKIPMCYIGADYCSKQDNSIPTANWPTINDVMKCGSASVLTTLFELDRVDRIVLIKNFVTQNPLLKGKIKLHVCWATQTGHNCCRCEKCLKTIIGLKSLNMDFDEYGFFEYPNMWKDIHNHIINDTFYAYCSFQWFDIQDSFNKDRGRWIDNPDVSWILDFDFVKQEKINKEKKEQQKQKEWLEQQKVLKQEKRELIKINIKKLLSSPILRVIKRCVPRFIKEGIKKIINKN